MDFCGFVADSMRWAKIYYHNPDFVYHLNGEARTLYLTFDDGPTPRVTEWILKTLDRYHARATFFMIGNNMAKYPSLVKMIADSGHSVGNHTYNHDKGFRTGLLSYIQSVRKAQELLPEESNLFRPPYGRIRLDQARAIQQMGLKIVLWSVISCDYEARISPQRCYNLVRRRLGEGKIIVFHDSLKAEKNMRYVLERLLDEYSDTYRFEAIRL